MNRKFFIAIFAFCAIAAAFVFAHGAFAIERKLPATQPIGHQSSGIPFVMTHGGSILNLACRAVATARTILSPSVQSERFNAHDIGRKPYDLLEKFGFAEIIFF